MHNWERTLSHWLMLVLTALTLAACGGGGDGDKVLPRASDYKLEATLSAAVIRANTTATVNVTVKTSTGTLASGGSLNYSIGGIQNVTISSSTGLSAGQSSATVQIGAASGSGSVIVRYTDPDGRTISTSVPFTVSNGDNVLLSADKPTVGSGGGTLTLTAYVTDSGGGIVANRTVTFSNGGDATNGTFQGGSTATTDANGIATKLYLSSTTDRSNKSVTLSASITNTDNTKTSAQLAIDVVGTTITLNTPNTSVTLGDSIPVTATLKDSKDAPISGATISFSSPGNSMSPASGVTDGSGTTPVSTAVINSAPNGNASIAANGYGASASLPLSVSGVSFRIASPAENGELTINTNHTIRVEWNVNGAPVANGKEVFFTTSSGTLSSNKALTNGGVAQVTVNSAFAGPVSLKANTSAADGNIQALRSALFVATTPATISAQASPSTVATRAETAIIATVLDTNANPVKGKTVEFNVCAGGTSGSLLTPSATTDESGKAKVTFRASNTTSANNGVIVTAAVQGTTVNTGACADTAAKHARLTVGGAALRVNIGTGDDIAELSTTTYSLPHTVTVADANGSPVSGADVTLSILSLQYFKGGYINGGGQFWVPFYSVTCNNEDLDHDGVLDASDNDANGNGVLEPGSPALLSASSVKTDGFGFANFSVNYPKSYGSWVKVRIRASVLVSGTESYATRDFILAIEAEDAKITEGDPPGGINSPFGTDGLCSSTN